MLRKLIMMMIMVLVCVFVNTDLLHAQANCQNDVHVEQDSVRYHLCVLQDYYMGCDNINIYYWIENGKQNTLTLKFNQSPYWNVYATDSTDSVVWSLEENFVVSADSQKLGPGETTTQESGTWVLKVYSVTPGTYTIHGEVFCDFPSSPPEVLKQIYIIPPETSLVDMPYLISYPGDTIDVPINLSHLAEKAFVYGIQTHISFDSKVLNPLETITQNTLIENWGQFWSSLFPGGVSLTAVGDTPLDSSGVLVYVRCEVADTTAPGTETILYFDAMILNEYGCPPVSATEGTLKVESSGVEDFDDGQLLPRGFVLLQNYPNPFNPSTKIEYYLLRDSKVELAVYDLLGRKVKTLVDGYQTKGHKSTDWDGKYQAGNEVPSGVYFYQLRVGDSVQSKKMMLLK